MWKAPSSLKRCVQRLLESKNIFMSCRCKNHHVLFILGPCPLYFGATRVNVRWLVCHWWTFIFFPFFLFIPPKITGWYSLLLVFQILFLFFWFLIFVLGLFVKILFISISSFYSKYGILFLPIWSLLFWFLLSFC
jgi:hypothetical protein